MRLPHTDMTLASAIIPWIVTAIRGGVVFGVSVFLINKLFGGSVISWYILCFGIPSHVVADFAGFSNITLDSNRKPAVLGTCCLVLVVLALVCGRLVVI